MKSLKQPQALKVKPVPVPSIDHPEPMSSQLMKHEFTLGLIGNFISVCDYSDFLSRPLTI
jgi:hypothetical protein